MFAAYSKGLTFLLSKNKRFDFALDSVPFEMLRRDSANIQFSLHSIETDCPILLHLVGAY